MTDYLLRVDDVLRRRSWTTRSARPWSAVGRLAANVVVFGMAYGAVLGSFGGFGGERLCQVVFAAVKVPLLLLSTFLLALPSFFVLGTLLGLRRDFVRAVRVLMATQAALAIILASLAPLTALWYVSSADYAAAVRFNVLIFACGSLAAQGVLRSHYRPLVERNRNHRWMFLSWLFIYAFVGIQMGWILRPFVGAPGMEVRFFREGPWGNAYVVVAGLLWRMLGG
jgi:hypothetical protein